MRILTGPGTLNHHAFHRGRAIFPCNLDSRYAPASICSIVWLCTGIILNLYTLWHAQEAYCVHTLKCDLFGKYTACRQCRGACSGSAKRLKVCMEPHFKACNASTYIILASVCGSIEFQLELTSSMTRYIFRWMWRYIFPWMWRSHTAGSKGSFFMYLDNDLSTNSSSGTDFQRNL